MNFFWSNLLRLIYYYLQEIFSGLSNLITHNQAESAGRLQGLPPSSLITLACVGGNAQHLTRINFHIVLLSPAVFKYWYMNALLFWDSCRAVTGCQVEAAARTALVIMATFVKDITKIFLTNTKIAWQKRLQVFRHRVLLFLHSSPYSCAQQTMVSWRCSPLLHERSLTSFRSPMLP